MNKIHLMLLVLGSTFSFSVFSQTVPTLPKEWKGEVSATSIGVAHKAANPNVSAQAWNTYDEPRTITITRQEGRHLELEIKNPRGAVKLIGTMSKSGKQMVVVDQSGVGFTFEISGRSLSGCGVSRGNSGTFDSWFNNYSTLCFDFTAVD